MRIILLLALVAYVSAGTGKSGAFQGAAAGALSSDQLQSAGISSPRPYHTIPYIC